MMRQSSASASSDNPSTSDQYPNDTDDSVAPNVLPKPKRKIILKFLVIGFSMHIPKEVNSHKH